MGQLGVSVLINNIQELKKKTANLNLHRRLPASHQDVKQYAFIGNLVIYSLFLQDELLMPNC
jgi:hypothetical protein